MYHEALNDIFVGLLAAIAIAAAVQDVKSFTISNKFSLALVILYPGYVLTATPEPDWLLSLGISAAVLILGITLFALKICGGGDVKLFAAITLWAGPGLFVEFSAVTAFTGGGIALSLWLANRAAPLLPFLSQGFSDDPEIFAKKPMPYGVAIGLGAVYVAFTLLR